MNLEKEENLQIKWDSRENLQKKQLDEEMLSVLQENAGKMVREERFTKGQVRPQDRTQQLNTQHMKI